jgi:NADH-quinone oxidoreductase subunit A
MSFMSPMPLLGTVAPPVSLHFGTVLIFVLVGLAFAGLALVVARLLRPHNPSPAKLTIYECGELPRGSSWIRFNVRFYLIALFFIIFDVEVIFLYPWAVVFRDLFRSGLGSLVLIEMAVFLAILSIGLAYIWVKGDLDWVKRLVLRNPDQAAPQANPDNNERQEEVPAP